MTRAISRSAVDWYSQKYGPQDIERWKTAGEIVIVEHGVESNGDKNSRN
jgi:hypothetical protein